MRKLLSLVLLLALPFLARSATGNTNILGAWIESDGYTISVVIGGDTSTSFGTNLFLYNGFLTSLATNYTAITGTQKCTLTITSSGWENGSQTTKLRTSYGTKIRRMPYPNYPTNWIFATESNGTNIIVRFATSEYVYAGETIEMTASPGWIVNTNANIDAAGVTALSVTNNSLLTFQKDSEPTMNWAHPGKNRWTNGTEYVYLKGGHWSGIDRVKVEAIDENANTNTVWASHIATSPGRGPKRGYWVAPISTATFSNLNQIRVDYVVYPKIGTNVFDTRLNRWTGLTPLPSAQTNTWDRFNIFTNIFVVALGGSDSTGAATNGSPENVDPAQYLLTVDQGWARLAATNNLLFGINEAIGTGYVKTGITNISGGTATAGNTARSWTILKNYPGDLVTFTNFTGHQDVSDCLKLEGDTSGSGGMRLDVDVNLVPFISCNQLWFDNITMDSASSQIIHNAPTVYITDSIITRFGQGLYPVAAQNTSFAIIRDTDVSGVNAPVWVRTAIGLSRRGASNTVFSIVDTRSNHGAPFNAHTIFCDSEFYQLGASTPFLFGGNGATDSHTNDVLHGFWSENILVESTNSPSNVALSFWNVVNLTNVVIKNWTVRGARQLSMYNETTNKWRITPHFYNNIFQVVGFANDLPNQNDPNATNSISVLYQVGSSGNIYEFPDGSTSHNWPDFDGVNNIIPGVGGTDLATNFVRFKSNQGYVSAATPGLGNYRLLSDNFFWAMPGAGQLPTHQPDIGFDLEGKPRSPIDPPGALIDGNVKKAGIGF